MVHYTFQHTYIQFQSYHQKWSNITIILYHWCANARVQKIYICEQREYKEMYKYKQYKSTHEFKKENSRDSQGGLEGWGSGRSAGDPRYRCATLSSNGGHPLAPNSKTWTWESRGVSETPQASSNMMPGGEPGWVQVSSTEDRRVRTQVKYIWTGMT